MDRPAPTASTTPAAGRVSAANPGRSRRLAAVLGAGGTLVAISQMCIVPLLPDLPRLTGASAADVSWLVTVTLLVGAVVTPLFGRAGDIFGKRRMLLVALGMLTAGSALCASTSSIWLLVLGRGLQGACLAIVPLSISILRDELPPERVGSAVAMMSATVGTGAALGVPFAALIVQVADWHVLFWVTGVLALTDLVLAWLIVRDSPVRAPARFDLPGAVGLAAGLLCLLLALSKGADWGFVSPRFLGLLLAAAVILAGWARWQLRATDPLVDLRVARRPAVLAPNIAALFVGFSFYANSLSTAQLVQVPRQTGYGLGLSVFASGLCLLPGGVAMVALSPAAARITATRGPRATLLLGTSALAGGYVLRMAFSDTLTMIVVGAAVVAAGTALAYSAMPMLTMRAVPRTQTAAANGLNVLLRTVGQAMCSAVVAAVLGHLTVSTSTGASPTMAAFRIVFATAAVVAVLAVVASLLVPTRAAATDTGRADASTRADGSALVDLVDGSGAVDVAGLPAPRGAGRSADGDATVVVRRRPPARPVGGALRTAVGGGPATAGNVHPGGVPLGDAGHLRTG
ncbi:MFS transporter [Frankia canadensis]|uniref:MFS transporter n=1 Tax=Frankia canadensis TaxID=1836972 RepID=UPI001FAF2E96|nr:MFS transporter [Frankia canadensis]